MFALLEERRANLAAQRVRSVNQLHRSHADLVAGGARTALTAKSAASSLRSVRPATPTDHAREALAWDLVRQIRVLDNQLAKIAVQMEAALEEYGSSLLEIDGVGPVLAVRLLGRAGRPSRFRRADAFASYTGAAPIEASSGERVVHRPSRNGDRKLNSALQLVAVTQVRMRGSDGRAYFDKKIAEGKTLNEAMRCLKRKLASHIWRRTLADEQSRIKDLQIAA